MGMPVIVPGSITKEAATGEIIESVAMEEKALAHILNAESEKLLAAVDNFNATPEELMKVNRSVESTVRAITRLEMMLQAKLELLQSTICRRAGSSCPVTRQQMSCRDPLHGAVPLKDINSYKEAMPT